MSLNFDKKIIAKNFSRAAQNYDKHAFIQKMSAEKLCDLTLPFILRQVWDDRATENQNEQKDFKILDLGSGTSFLAKEFLNHAEFQQKNIKFYEVDLSLEMLNSWVERPKKNFFIIQGDIENLPFEAKFFDLIISSFSLQWLPNLPKVLSQISSLLKSDGIFAFCIPTYKTLSELREASISSGCNFHFNDLPKNKDLNFALAKSDFKKKFAKTEIIKQEFATACEALRSLKMLGANCKNSTSEKGSVTKEKLDKFNSFCLKNFRASVQINSNKGSSAPNKKIAVSWHNSYFISNL